MYESSYREPPPYKRPYHLSYQSSYILVLVPLFAYEKELRQIRKYTTINFRIMVWYRAVYSAPGEDDAICNLFK